MVTVSFIVAALSTFSLASANPTHHAAANGTSTSVSAPSGTGSPKPAQTVSVGKNGLTFTPDTISAKIGEQIVFQFSPKNHSVVQSDFKTPCKPKDGGIFSGFFFTPQGLSNQTFTVTIKDDKPIWLYCAQNMPKPHCAAGMVAVINPPSSGANLEQFKLAAAQTNSTGSTAPAGGPVGGQVSALGSPMTPGSLPPMPPALANSTNAASELAVGGMLGLMAVLTGLLF